MERLVDVGILIGRILHWRTIRQEIRPLATMVADSLWQKQKPKSNGSPPAKRTTIFMPGFIGHESNYQNLNNFLDERRIQVLTPIGFGLNLLSWKRAQELISKAIKQAEDKTGTVPAVIGHSKGGTEMLGIIPRHPEIEEVILIAAPLRGPSFEVLSLFVDTVYGKGQRPFDEDMLTDRSILSKITTIVSDADHIVPPEEAKLPGVKRQIFFQGHRRKQTQKRMPDFIHWDSHTGLPYRAAGTIFFLLVQEQKAA